jgi:hypothetical protein
MHHTIIMHEESMSQDNITPPRLFFNPILAPTLHSYSMIKDGVPISEKFEGLMMKPASKSISPLLKLELTKMNHSSVKIPRKRKEKITCFSHPGVCSSRM